MSTGSEYLNQLHFGFVGATPNQESVSIGLANRECTPAVFLLVKGEYFSNSATISPGQLPV